MKHVTQSNRLTIHYYFTQLPISWFRSFLTNRFQIVKYQNFCSPKFSVPSGVPQGDHLSTLLFNIFINDLPDVNKNSEIFLFANDTKLLKIINDTQDATDLQMDLNNLQNWCESNDLFLNIEKCKVMRFNLIKNPIIFNYSISNSNLELVSNFKDLGIIFDFKLNFSYHTEFIKNKEMRILGFNKRSCKDFCDPFALKILYCSLVRSNLEYCPFIWINDTSKQNYIIEAVQNNFLRFMSFKCNIHRLPHCS